MNAAWWAEENIDSIVALRCIRANDRRRPVQWRSGVEWRATTACGAPPCDLTPTASGASCWRPRPTTLSPAAGAARGSARLPHISHAVYSAIGMADFEGAVPQPLHGQSTFMKEPMMGGADCHQIGRMVGPLHPPL